MHEMKFMLVGTPKRDSAWLHLSADGRAGISVWRSGRLSHLDFPACWLSPFLWLIPVGCPVKIKARGQMAFLKKVALQECMAALVSRDRVLLAQSMCTLFGYQHINGAPPLPLPVPFTIGRIFATDHNSGKPYLIGTTALPIVKAVLK